MFVAGHFYAEGSPYVIAREDFRAEGMRLKVVADVSCDIDERWHVRLDLRLLLSLFTGTIQ